MSESEEAAAPAPGPRAVPADTVRLGPGHHFQGDLTGSEDLVVQGTFKGKIFLLGRTVTIDPKAEVVGDIEAGDIFVAGSLIGNIRSTGRVTLAASAGVKGDIIAARISIQDGARFRGAIQMRKD